MDSVRDTNIAEKFLTAVMLWTEFGIAEIEVLWLSHIEIHVGHVLYRFVLSCMMVESKECQVCASMVNHWKVNTLQTQLCSVHYTAVRISIELHEKHLWNPSSHYGRFTGWISSVSAAVGCHPFFFIYIIPILPVKLSIFPYTVYVLVLDKNVHPRAVLTVKLVCTWCVSVIEATFDHYLWFHDL